jgi:hypothetical protein
MGLEGALSGASSNVNRRRTGGMCQTQHGVLNFGGHSTNGEAEGRRQMFWLGFAIACFSGVTVIVAFAVHAIWEAKAHYERLNPTPRIDDLTATLDQASEET